MDAVQLEWTGAPGLGPLPAAPPSHLALRNYALLVHRQEVDRAASQSICSKTSLSGWHDRRDLMSSLLPVVVHGLPLTQTSKYYFLQSWW